MKCDPKTINRLKRVIGQLNGVLKMMEGEDKTCGDLVMQLTSAKTSVSRLINLLTTQNLINSIESHNNIELSDIDDAVKLLIKTNNA